MHAGQNVLVARRTDDVTPGERIPRTTRRTGDSDSTLGHMTVGNSLGEAWTAQSVAGQRAQRSPASGSRPTGQELPRTARELDTWLVARLRDLRPGETAAALADAEALACRRFPAATVVAAIRRVLRGDLLNS